MSSAKPQTPQASLRNGLKKQEALPSEKAGEQKPSAVWKCEALRGKEAENHFPDGITSGEVYGLTCHGDSVTWQSSQGETVPKITLGASEKSKFRLQEVKLQEFSSTQYKALVVTYQISEEPLPSGEVFLTDGHQKLALDFGEVKFKSVLPKEQTEIKPFPPFGPVSFQLPNWVAYSLIVVLVLILSFVAYKLTRFLKARWVRKNLVKYLETHQTALKPSDHLAKEIRVRKKSWNEKIQFHDEVRTLRSLYLDFISREFFIPAQHLTEKKILIELKSYFASREVSVIGQAKQVFTELERAEFSATLGLKDLEQISEMILNSAAEMTSKRAKNRMKKK